MAECWCGATHPEDPPPDQSDPLDREDWQRREALRTLGHTIIGELRIPQLAYWLEAKLQRLRHRRTDLSGYVKELQPDQPLPSIHEIGLSDIDEVMTGTWDPTRDMPIEVECSRCGAHTVINGSRLPLDFDTKDLRRAVCSDCD